MTIVAIALVAYLLGSIPFGLVLTRAFRAGDLRQIGSGSIGATNVLRTGRKGLAAATLVLDAGKGAVAVLIGAHWAAEAGILAAGLAAVIGHMFPIWLSFRGGKGVATGLGVLLAASPLAALACGAVWAAVAFVLRISSAASLTACLAAPLMIWLITASGPLTWLAAFVAALIWVRHHGNIRRLLAGTEPRIGRS